ncbi:hypothetical protein FSC37_09925 [Piscinibacter aquaticus]|uniref:Uncharacterized protein n=1 Tax=Piscinibacter aquaticus TaxID=392597 RepID=A0A5C6TZK0_9BURK|nr:hypothetical protein FSC37_09925 [Piscinibacter aquaticus]
MRQRSREWSDVYKLDMRTLKFELLSFESPGRTAGWVLDNKNIPRIAQRYEPRPAKGKPYAMTTGIGLPRAEHGRRSSSRAARTSERTSTSAASMRTTARST